LCHDQSIIHRDLKLENVLFSTTAHRKIKVVDFGIAGMCTGGAGEQNDASTLRYTTPEMLLSVNSKANPAMDVWAIGIMLYYMLFNEFPFNGKEKDDIREAIKNKPLKMPKYATITSELIDFVSACLIKNPAKRIMTKEMLIHPWMLMSDDDLEDKFEQKCK
jgi:serine/threonine protein kinase KIN1/2